MPRSVAAPTSLGPSRPSAALPSAGVMYQAFVQRDTSFEGVFVMAVRTTGIFCRPGCGARPPRRENVEFFPGATEAAREGFRPCRRCRPDEPREPEWARTLLEAVEADPAARWTAADLRARGIDPARAQRYFKTRFGVTFQEYHRARRVGSAISILGHGARMSTAASTSGYESESGLRSAVRRLAGVAPSQAREADIIHAASFDSPVGRLLACATRDGLRLLEFCDDRGTAERLERLRSALGLGAVIAPHAALDQLRGELDRFFAGTLTEFRTPLAPFGTPFQVQVWKALIAIPHGETRSYAEIARAIGRPTAVRAVARANAQNRIAILIPCHRVIGSNGALTGYAGGLWRKERLLQIEGVRLSPSAPGAAIAPRASEVSR